MSRVSYSTKCNKLTVVRQPDTILAFTHAYSRISSDIRLQTYTDGTGLDYRRVQIRHNGRDGGAVKGAPLLCNCRAAAAASGLDPRRATVSFLVCPMDILQAAPPACIFFEAARARTKGVHAACSIDGHSSEAKCIQFIKDDGLGHRHYAPARVTHTVEMKKEIKMAMRRRYAKSIGLCSYETLIKLAGCSLLWDELICRTHLHTDLHMLILCMHVFNQDWLHQKRSSGEQRYMSRIQQK
eukprot:4524257-Pleurochrysis_carterae.AAC.1